MILMCVSMYNASTAIVSNFCSEKSGSCSPDCFQALAVLKEAAIVDLPSQAVNCSCDGMTSWCGYHQQTQWLSTERKATHQKVLIQKTVKSPGAESRWQEQLQRNYQGTTSLLYGWDPIISLPEPTKPGQERNTFRNTVNKMFQINPQLQEFPVLPSRSCFHMDVLSFCDDFEASLTLHHFWRRNWDLNLDNVSTLSCSQRRSLRNLPLRPPQMCRPWWQMFPTQTTSVYRESLASFCINSVHYVPHQ